MISVILATKNGEKYIDRAIESVLNQTEKDIELIVISDGSTDGTPSKVKDWNSKDQRVKLIELESNVGPGIARDCGIRKSQGQYIAFIDDDDYWISKEKLSLQKKFLDEHADHVAVGSTVTHLVDENDSLIRYFHRPSKDAKIKKTILLRNCFVTTSVMCRKDTYLQAGGFKNMYLSEDYELWLRMGLLGKFANIPDTEVAYTIRNASASRSKKLELYRTNLALVKTHKKDYPGSIKGRIICYLRIFLYYLNLA